jgi:hypothetical protein
MTRRGTVLDQEILTVEPAADYLRVHKLTVYRYMKQK